MILVLGIIWLITYFTKMEHLFELNETINHYFFEIVLSGERQLSGRIANTR